MDPADMDWARAHEEGRTPWDLRGATEPLRALARCGYFSRLDLPVPTRVAVPGCGLGHDLKVFADLGMAVTGFDFVPAVVREAPELLALNRVRADVLCRDVLGLAPEFASAFDLVYDYTCFCALRPHLWPAYAATLAAILRPKGLLLMLAFPMMPRRDRLRGPPYRVLEADLVRALSPHFRLVENFRADGSPVERMGYERWYLWSRRS